MRLLLLYFATCHIVPVICFRLFDSRDRHVHSVIEQCESKMPHGKKQCYDVLRCIIDNVPSDFPARWSAGSSILAFVPTIVALLSNSIDEVTSIADESTLLAVALSLSSVSAFVFRLRNKAKTTSDTFFVEQTVGSKSLEVAWTKLENQMLNYEKQGSKPWWLQRKTYSYIVCLMLVVLSAAIWFEVLQTIKYGIVVFACPVKVNVGIWVGLSQVLVLLNVGCRYYVFDIRTIYFKYREPSLQTRREGTNPPLGTSERQQPATPFTNNAQKLPARLIPVKTSESFTVVLRSPNNTMVCWLLQTFTAVASLALYTYGTVILGSMTLIPSSDAVRFLTILTIGAGSARLFGSLAASPSKMASRVVLIDVPLDCMEDFHTLLLEQARARI